MITLIDKVLLDELCAEAATSPRRRKNRNFHTRDEHPAQRLLNALQTDTYVQPHRHLGPHKDESFIVLRGRLGLIVFDDRGQVLHSVEVAAGGAVLGVDIPRGTWHTAVALAADTVFFEAKAGPYLPFTADERATWAPAENTPDAMAWLSDLKARLFGVP